MCIHTLFKTEHTAVVQKCGSHVKSVILAPYEVKEGPFGCIGTCIQHRQALSKVYWTHLDPILR